jgi:hypothetical protein
MQTKRIPLAGSMLARSYGLASTRDQKFVNCFSMKVSDDFTGGSRIFTRKRLGFTAATTFANLGSASNVFCVWQSNTTPCLVFACNDSPTAGDCSFYKQDGTQIGATIANFIPNQVIDTIISGVSNLVCIGRDYITGVCELWYFPLGGAWTQVTDTDFPPNQTPTIVTNLSICTLDGYLFVITTSGQLWNSDLNSISSWSLNNFLVAQSSPDGGKFVCVSGDNIIVIGDYSIEFFRNTGNPTGSPLSSIPKSIRLGFGTKPIYVGDSLYLSLRASEVGSVSIYRIINGEIEKISTPEIDLYYSKFLPYCYGAFSLYGYTHVPFGIGVGSASDILCYTVETKRWWSLTEASGLVMSSFIRLSSTSQFAYIQSDTGLLFKMNTWGAEGTGSPPSFQDSGVSVPMTIQLAPLDFGTPKKKFAQELRLIGDKQASTCNVAVSWSDDDAVTFSTPVNIDMSNLDNAFISRPRLGSAFRRRVFKLTNAVNLPLSLEAIEIDYDVATI